MKICMKINITRYACDQYRKVVEDDGVSYSGRPCAAINWYTVGKQGENTMYFCSKKCLFDHISPNNTNKGEKNVK